MKLTAYNSLLKNTLTAVSADAQVGQLLFLQSMYVYMSMAFCGVYCITCHARLESRGTAQISVSQV